MISKSLHEPANKLECAGRDIMPVILHSEGTFYKHLRLNTIGLTRSRVIPQG